jgi:hypothetical protein
MLPYPILHGWIREKVQCAGVSAETAEGSGTRRTGSESSSDGTTGKQRRRDDKNTRTMGCFEEAEMPLHELPALKHISSEGASQVGQAVAWGVNEPTVTDTR